MDVAYSLSAIRLVEIKEKILSHARRHTRKALRFLLLPILPEQCEWIEIRSELALCNLAMDIHALLDKNLKSCPLTILVFGPSTSAGAAGAADIVAGLLSKRLQIRTRLQTLGHTVVFPEEVVAPASKSPAHNEFF